MPVTWSWSIEMSADDVIWYDITRDVVKTENISMKRSMAGTTPTDCVADPGTLSFVLDNSEANSAHLLGYYSPGHTNCRSIFALGSYVRINLVSAPTANMIKFKGRIRVIDPDIGQFKTRETYVQAVDYMQYFVENYTERLAVQVNKRFDQLISALIPTPAPSSSIINVDPSTTALAFHLERDEQTTLMQVLQKICQSTLGKLYVAGDEFTGEVLIYENRYTRSYKSVSLTLDNTMTEMSISWQQEKKYSKVKASITPYSVDDSPVILASLESEIPIRSGTTETIELRLHDPNGSERISGYDFVTPLVAGTHYNASAFSGTTNGDVNSAISIVTTFGSNTVRAAITNSGGVTAYLNMLDIMGKGIYPYDVIDFSYGSGNNVLNYSMPYLNDANLGRSIGQVIYNRAILDVPEISGISFYADGSTALMQRFLNTDIGSKVKIIEAAAGVDMEGFLNGWDAVIENGATLKVNWLFVPAESQGRYFTLDDAVKGVLDNTIYVLGV